MLPQYKRSIKVGLAPLTRSASLTFLLDQENPDPALGLDPRVVESYRTCVSPFQKQSLSIDRFRRVGTLLHTYRSGPLPKIFKIIPSLPTWARILALTSPESWSPHACRAATKMFISNMKPAQAQLFLNVVLLDAIRADITENKKLNVHYYESLKKALYKPGAFFKGLIFPLLDVCIFKVCPCLFSFVLARMYTERGGHCCISTSKNQSPCPPFICSTLAYRGDGLLRWVIPSYI